MQEDGSWPTGQDPPAARTTASPLLDLGEVLGPAGRLGVDRVDLTRCYASTLPRSFVNATADTALPPASGGWHPRMSSRLGMYRLVQFTGSHEVRFTAPERLADAFVRAGRD